jgi:hypothetical protein
VHSPLIHADLLDRRRRRRPQGPSTDKPNPAPWAALPPIKGKRTRFDLIPACVWP